MKRALAFTAAIHAFALAAAITAQPSANSSGDGQRIFRFDTFGDEQLWTGALHMEKAIASVSPETALAVGLKVDLDALPPATVDALRKGAVNLKDPAVTIQLLSLNAIVGVMGRVSAGGSLESIGVTCALCHSTVDNSLAPGVGTRLDGGPNRDLNVGAIIALSPVLTEERKAVFNSWGKGKYDPRLQTFDGSSFTSLNSPSFPVLIPPAYGQRGVGFETFTGEGPMSYWNSYVGVSQMGGHGSFSDSRIGVTIKQEPDQVTPKLPALLDYQRKLRAPAPPRGSFNMAAARRGEQVFSGAARCGRCT